MVRVKVRVRVRVRVRVSDRVRVTVSVRFTVRRRHRGMNCVPMLYFQKKGTGKQQMRDGYLSQRQSTWSMRSCNNITFEPSM